MALSDVLAAFFVSFVVVAVSTPVIRRYALQWKLGDKPNGRKIHTSTIPHVGGVGMVVGLAASVAVVIFLGSTATQGLSSLMTKLAIPVALIVGLGLTDDMKNLKALQKLIIQIISAVILAVSGIHLLTGFGPIDGSTSFVILFTSFYLVGISSSVNLIDGHDGLAAGLSLISVMAFAIIALMTGTQPLFLVSLAMMGACLGFLLYNFPPGKIFMGDTGSMFLGIMLGIIACVLTMTQPAITTFLAVWFVLSIPILDSMLAVARRLALRKPIFHADCHHVHHILTSFGFSPRQTLTVLYVMQGFMALLGILVMQGFVIPLVVGIVFQSIVFLGFIRVMVASKQSPKKVPANFTPRSIPSLEK